MSNSVNFYEFIGFITFNIEVFKLRGKVDKVWANNPVSTGIGPSHCQNGRLGKDLGFGGFAFALKLPELLNTNLPTVSAKLGQTSSFPNGPQIWFPVGQ